MSVYKDKRTGHWGYNFMYADTRINSSNWQQQAWWWTLDGWQFEQEVARVFRLNDYKALIVLISSSKFVFV